MLKRLTGSNPTKQVPGLFIGCIGDQTSIGSGSANVENGLFNLMPLFFNIGKQTVTASSLIVGSTTADHLPSSGTGYHTTALANFATNSSNATIKIVSIMLGVNDAGASVSSATYKANLETIRTAWINAGYQVIIHHPIWCANSTRETALAGYRTQINAITSIKLGDTLGQPYFSSHSSLISGDNITPTQSGIDYITRVHAEAIWRGFYYG